MVTVVIDGVDLETVLASQEYKTCKGDGWLALARIKSGGNTFRLARLSLIMMV